MPGDFRVAQKNVLPGRPPLIRQTNAEILLRLLRETGPCSKADLVRASGLSAPSVTNVVGTLLSTGLVETLGEGSSTGGRPPDILRFNAQRGCAAGIEITHGTLRFLLVDLSGTKLISSDIPVKASKSTPAEVCRQISRELDRLVSMSKVRKKQLLRVVVGVPAIVNVDEGTVLALSALRDWSNVPFGAMLARELRCPVLIDNDTNLAAQGEFHRGAAKGEEDFVYLTIGEGVGAGIFLGGSIRRGSQWSAGEIGYLRVPSISRDHPSIHQYGKLEIALSASIILKTWRSRRNAAKARDRVRRAADVWDLAAAGNPDATKILRQHATILSDVILDLSLILNPSLILLGGEVGNHPALLFEVNKLLAGSEFAVMRVGLGTLGDSAVLWGAVSMAIEPAVRALLQADRFPL